MKFLHISKEIAVPIELVTEKLAWIGVTGSGKSYGASKAAEELWHAQAQFVVLDPVGTWYGLRLGKDGKTPGIPVPVFGGLHGDVPLEATGGALVADLVVDKNLSVVLDVSQFESDAQKARFVSDFAERFFHRKKAAPSAVHVFLEEAQEFVPQNPQRGEEMMLHRLHRLQKLGRNFGIGTSIITQRPQETSKKALNQAQTVFAFRLTGSQERKAVELWIQDKGLDQDLVASLPKLETGTCHVWSPAWLRVSKVVRIAPKETYDASATPKVGERAAARTLAPIDLERLRTAMAATIEKAKADDPKILQAKIAELQKKLYGLETKKHVAAPEPKIERVEVPVLRESDSKRLMVSVCRAEAMLMKTREAVVAMAKLVEKAVPPIQSIKSTTEWIKHIPMAPLGPMEARARGIDYDVVRLPGVRTVIKSERKEYDVPIKAAVAAGTKRFAVAFTSPEARRFALAAPGDESLSQPQQRILATLVFLQSIGVETADKFQVALFVGVSPNSGSYANNLGALRTAGLVAYPNPGQVAITPSGLTAAPAVTIPTTTAELHAHVLAKLARPQQAILEKLLEAFPRQLTKQSVAEQLGVSSASGSYANNLGHLRTMGAITYPTPGYVCAAHILFIEGN